MEQFSSIVKAVFFLGLNGWSLDRTGFNEFRRAAEKGRFDAVMFWKFDRLARNHDHAVMIKILLRSEYGLKLYCVEGFSEDEDDSPYTAMMEQMLAIFSAFYSKNLSNETKRGKRQRAMNGEYNGSAAPFGYNLVTKRQATEDRRAGLHINPQQAIVVRQMFEIYATGEYSDIDIARWLNQQSVVQKLREGKKPFGKETVRDMLRNRLYTGRVSYTETFYSGTLGEGRKASRNRKQWFEGIHEPIIDDDLSEYCQQIRKDLTKVRHSPSKLRAYLLHDRTYCARCVATKPRSVEDVKLGKMRPNWDAKRGYGYYRCIAHNRGYRRCEQSAVRIDLIDEQVVFELSRLVIPEGFKQRVEEAVQSKVENAEALRRMEEIWEAVKRIDFSWERGYLTPEEYTQKRNQLEAEIASMRPIDYDDLMEAADLLENFNRYWQKCDDVDDSQEARKQLLAKIIDRVFVWDESVIAIALHGDFSVVLDSASMAPIEVVRGIKK